MLWLKFDLWILLLWRHNLTFNPANGIFEKSFFRMSHDDILKLTYTVGLFRAAEWSPSISADNQTGSAGCSGWTGQTASGLQPTHELWVLSDIDRKTTTTRRNFQQHRGQTSPLTKAVSVWRVCRSSEIQRDPNASKTRYKITGMFLS